jgi:membrane protease YdiL (CAAX protease family)
VHSVKQIHFGWAASAELVLVGLIVCCGSFSALNLVLLLLLSSQSLWLRGLGWLDVGLSRPPAWRTTLLAAAVSVALLVAIRIVIVPFAVLVAREPVDLSVFGTPGDSRSFLMWLAEAWTLAAFGEEMVFRGYLIGRISEVMGNTGIGRIVAVTCSGLLFGFAHRYQGWAGVVATASIGMVLGMVYLCGSKNLWTVIVSHGIVDSVILWTLYSGHSSLLFP